jgi:hypothetical protein
VQVPVQQAEQLHLPRLPDPASGFRQSLQWIST